MRAAIVDCVRTAIAPAFVGPLRWARPDDLAANCVDELLDRNPRVPTTEVDDCIIGCGFPEGPQGMNIGRNVAVLSGLGRDVAGLTVSRYCASGLDAVAVAASRITSGTCDAVVAGGVESISTTMRVVNTSGLFNPAISERSPGTYVGMALDDPSIPFWKRAFRSMGETAELLAERHGIGRQEQDAFACSSQQRVVDAVRAGRFREEIVAAERGKAIEADGCVRPDTTPQVLAELESAFRPDGTVTAGNASPIADGAAASLLTSERYAVEHELSPLAFFRGYVTVGCEPQSMAYGPVLAIRKLLQAFDLRLGEIDLFEINEAFSAQMIYCVRELGLDEARVNVDGGAIALGHPFGMTGVRLVGHLARALKARGGGLGVVSICVGGGMGLAALIQT